MDGPDGRAAATGRLARLRVLADEIGVIAGASPSTTSFVELQRGGGAAGMRGAELEWDGQVVRIRLPTGTTTKTLAALARRLRREAR